MTTATMEKPATEELDATAADIQGLVDAALDLEPAEAVEGPAEKSPEGSSSDPAPAVNLEQNPPEAAPVDPRAEMARQIEELQKEVADQACEVARRAGGLKSAKKEFDGLVEELRDLERRFESGDYGLAFDPSKSAGDVPAGTGAAQLDGQMTLPLPDPNSPEELDWRSTPIGYIGLTGKLLESIEGAGLTTMGLLADYTAAGKLLTDIGGIGPGKAEKIEQACEKFWAKRAESQLVLHQGAAALNAAGMQAEVTHAPSTIDEAQEAGAESPEETDAYAAGCDACIAEKGVASNPHKKGSRLWQMFDQGWQDTNNA